MPFIVSPRSEWVKRRSNNDATDGQASCHERAVTAAHEIDD
jgi:hypothetical protein